MVMDCSWGIDSTKGLTLALSARILIKVLTEEDDVDTGGQLRLFNVAMEDRERFEEMAETLSFMLTTCEKEWNWELPLLTNELVEIIQRRTTDEKLQPRIADLIAVANGEPLQDTVPLVNFLASLESLGIWMSHSGSKRGGCF